jgi:peptidoglycan-N-acetylglucosamine deacetylase
MQNLLTVDVEDWFHICDIEHILPSARWDACESRVAANIESILALLNRFGVKATFFVLGYTAQRSPEVVRMICREGHEIACHGYGHVQVYKLTKQEFLLDLRRSKELLQDIAGQEVIGYRAPEWSICEGKRNSMWALDLLSENGFMYDSSIAPLRFIGVPRAPVSPYSWSTPSGAIREFPPLVTPSSLGNLPVGGGWGLRVFPYAWIREAVARLNALGHPAVFFIHPSDFDSVRPSLRLPWIKRFVCHGKIRTTTERMTSLLGEYAFTSVKRFLCREM